MDKYDIVIIGAGVVGCSIARYLSGYEARICVIERNEDVCEGTSKANSAIVHAGHDATPGTLKARLNVEGNMMMDQVSRELDVPFKRCGAFVVCFEDSDIPKLEELCERGKGNGVTGLKVVSGDEARKMEPNLSDNIKAALHVPA